MKNRYSPIVVNYGLTSNHASNVALCEATIRTYPLYLDRPSVAFGS